MIICQVTGAAITVAQNELLTTGMVQAVPVRFCFSPQWAALDRTAVFTAGTVSVSCLLGEDNQCFIPWECLTRAGEYLHVGVYGTRGEEMVLPTVSCLLGPICTGTQPEENTPTEATPTLVQSLLTKAEAAVSVADALRTDADAGLFNRLPRAERGNRGNRPSRAERRSRRSCHYFGEHHPYRCRMEYRGTLFPSRRFGRTDRWFAGGSASHRRPADGLAGGRGHRPYRCQCQWHPNRLCSGGRPRRRSDPADYHHCHGAVKFSLSGSSPVGRQNSTQPAAAHFGGGFPQNTVGLASFPQKVPPAEYSVGGTVRLVFFFGFSGCKPFRYSSPAP